MYRTFGFCIATLFLLVSNLTRAEQYPFEFDSAGSGRDVYLIPGLSNSGDVWDDLAGRLRTAGYRTHVLTLSGFGGRSPIEDGPFLPRVRDALAAELAAGEGSKPVVIGHSLGGFLAFWLGATEAEHLAGIVAVDGVPFLPALADPSATPEAQAPVAEQIRAFMASLTPEQFAQQNRMSLKTMLHDDKELDRIAMTSTRSDPAAVGQAVLELMTIDLRPLMAEITVPALLLQAADSGSGDAMRAAYAAQIAEIPDHRHVVAEQGSHFVQLDDPDFTAREVLAFMESLDE
ncbi:MAG: alpha/beta fold hydrolase [Wenzhouxiangella sp.]